MAKNTAIIDIGSNSITLVIYQKTSRFAFIPLHKEKVKVRIGEGSYDKGGILQEKPMQRAYEALYDFSHIIKAYRCRKTLTIATSALRDAPNSHEFIKKIKDDLAINIKIIDGDKEAYYGGVSAINLLPKLSEFTTIDIGGGSCELAKVIDGKVIKTLSLELGHVRLYEKSMDIDEVLKTIDDEFKSDTVVGIGGTARAISKYIQKKSSYPLDKLHSYSYSFTTEKDSIDLLQDMNEKELLDTHISSNRVETIKVGALIFSKVLNYLGCKDIIVNSAGVREGAYLCDLLRTQNHLFPANFDMSVKSLLDRFTHLPKQSAYTNNISTKLFLLTSEDDKYKNELNHSSRLLNLALRLDGDFLLENLSFGHTHKEMFTIYFLLNSLTHGLSLKKLEKYSILLPSLEEIEYLLFILSLTRLITKNKLIQKVNIIQEENELVIGIENISHITLQEIQTLKNPTKYKIKVNHVRKSI